MNTSLIIPEFRKTNSTSGDVGYNHEKWIIHSFKKHKEQPFVKLWLSNLFENVLIDYSVMDAYSHTEKMDIQLHGLVKKTNSNIQKNVFLGISAKAGKSEYAGHLHSNNFEKATEYNLAPSFNECSELHKVLKTWLTHKIPLEELSVSQKGDLLVWFKDHWEGCIEQALFGLKPKENEKTNKANSLIMTDLAYCPSNLPNMTNFICKRTTALQKKTVIEQLKFLSPFDQVAINSRTEKLGYIQSGIISIGREGGKNGGNSACNLKFRLNRYAYLQWLQENNSDMIYINEDLNC